MAQEPVETTEPYVLEYRVVYLETNEDLIGKGNEVKIPSLAVDASFCSKDKCLKNPAPQHRNEIFRLRPLNETDKANYLTPVGEFLALVEGLKWLKDNNLDIHIYSDSEIVLGKRNNAGDIEKKAWIENVPINSGSRDCCPKIHDLIVEAERWVQSNKEWLKERLDNKKILKWDTDKWGEIPADFNRK
ncbi:hypothetical protein AGMMS49521_2160 [Campylobacterota bacterium]|nr:hypothetical protein AGMMS49521_2160 [Campylobacterota bacterium]